MSLTATLAYEATAVGPTVPANLEAAMQVVDLTFNAIEQATGCTLISDVTTLVGSIATRTIVFDINTAQFKAEFPAGTDQAAPFYGLYTQALSRALNSLITEIPPVIV
jgi:hypothetical protein